MYIFHLFDQLQRKNIINPVRPATKSSEAMAKNSCIAVGCDELQETQRTKYAQICIH